MAEGSSRIRAVAPESLKDVVAERDWLSLELPMGYTCPKCGRKLRNSQALAGHARSHQRQREMKEESRQNRARAANKLRARRAVNLTVLSPEPLRMVFPHEIGLMPMLGKFHLHVPDNRNSARSMRMVQERLGIRQADWNVMNPTKPASMGHPRMYPDPSSSLSQISSSTGSTSGTDDNELDLELKL